MGNALEAVLRLKEAETQREQFQSQQITQAAQIFQQARESSQRNQLDKLRLSQNQKQFDVSSGQDAQRIDISRDNNILQRRGQNIDLSKFGLQENGDTISENPGSSYQKNIESEILGRKDNAVIAKMMKGIAVQSSGLDMQKQAYEAEDDAAYQEGEQLRGIGRNIIKSVITPSDQTVAGHLDPETAKITPFVPLVENKPAFKEEKTLSQIKEERLKKEEKRKLEYLKQEEEIKAAPKKEENAKLEKVREENEKNFSQDLLNTISEVEKGIKYFGAAGPIPALPGEYNKVNWRANFDKLISKNVLDELGRLKSESKTGATGFGQLSNKELGLLTNAASVLKVNMSEEDAARYLKIMKPLLEKTVGKQAEGKPKVDLKSKYGLE